MLLAVNGVWTTIWSVAIALLILLAMITVHEFGHYIVGKIFHFKIKEFAIGFGPRIFKKTKKNGEEFSIRALPLGGFCAFAGEEREEDETPDCFYQRPPWQRILVLFAGAFMNYLLALLIIIVWFFGCGQQVYTVQSTVHSESSIHYVQEGDSLLAIEGHRLYLPSDLYKELSGKRQGDVVQVEVGRGTERVVLPITLQADCIYGNGVSQTVAFSALGVGTKSVVEDGKEVKYYDLSVQNYRFHFFESVGDSFVYSGKLAGSIFEVLGQLFTGKLGVDSLGGPISTIQMTSQLVAGGVESFFQIFAYIGINLAIFNLLPIPALDGCKIIFTTIEWIFKKPIPRMAEMIISAVGMVLLIGFAVMLDLLRLF